MVILDAADVDRRMSELAEELIGSGHLRTAPWRRAFRAVRRHVFVPRFWNDDEPGAFPARWRMVDSATKDYREWLTAVYSDRTLATELIGAPALDGRGMHPQVTSSSTMPSLVLSMLEHLDIADGMRVLEIGTGTGYNAALLCERLGQNNVTSIDVSPELVALAGVRLADHGYRPQLIAADGADGAPARGPFDRIIATCGVDDVPVAWLDQTRDGGKILLNLLGPFHKFALALLTVDGGRATGPFLTQSGGFMPRRADPALPFDYRVTVARMATDVTEGDSVLDPKLLYSSPTWGLLAQTVLSSVSSRQIYLDDAQQHLGTELATADGSSWAAVAHDADRNAGFRVQQAGTRRLWTELERLHWRWTALGRPCHDRFGLTVGSGRVELWLDDPSEPDRWRPGEVISTT